MTPWQLGVMVEGFNRANAGPAKAPAPSMDEHRERTERALARRRKPSA